MKATHIQPAPARDDALAAHRTVAKTTPALAIIKDSDPKLCSTLAETLHMLGIAQVLGHTRSCPQDFANKTLAQVPDSGVLVFGMRDAVLGPIEISDLRLALAGWVIIVIDWIGNAHSAADALAAGADDVLAAPVVAAEFEARVALRMRQAGMAETSSALKSPLIARAQLTPVESEIMRILLAHKGQIVTRNQLSQRLDSADWLYGDRKFDVHITRIRKKLRAAYNDRFQVHTIRAQGYMVELTEDASQP